MSKISKSEEISVYKKYVLCQDGKPIDTLTVTQFDVEKNWFEALHQDNSRKEHTYSGLGIESSLPVNWKSEKTNQHLEEINGVVRDEF